MFSPRLSQARPGLKLSQRSFLFLIIKYSFKCSYFNIQLCILNFEICHDQGLSDTFPSQIVQQPLKQNIPPHLSTLKFNFHFNHQCCSISVDPGIIKKISEELGRYAPTKVRTNEPRGQWTNGPIDQGKKEAGKDEEGGRVKV